MAANRSSSSSLTVSITIDVSGRTAAISRVAWTPDLHGHPDIHQDEVRFEAKDEVDGLSAIRRTADDLVAPGLQQRRDPVTKERMVVGEDDPHQVTPSGAGSGDVSTATRSSTRQPPVAGLVQSTVPAMLCARSRIASMP